MKSRIALYCLVRDQSIQILGPLGKDLWVGIAFLKTENLVFDQAVHAQCTEVFLEVLDRQDKGIASSQVKEIGVKDYLRVIPGNEYFGPTVWRYVLILEFQRLSLEVLHITS
jgi:hypothetical protein